MKNLRSFLESQGSHVVEVEEPLSRRYEIAALLQRFDGEIVRVVEEDTGVTVVGGVAGRRERLLEALGASPRELYPRLLEAVRNPQPCQEGDGPVSEVVEKGNLHEIPVLTHFEGDPGPYITSGVLHTMGHDGEHENVSFHRLLVLDGKRMAIRVVPRHLYRILQLAREAGEKTLDAAVTIGHHPVTLLAAALPAPFLPPLLKRFCPYRYLLSLKLIVLIGEYDFEEEQPDKNLFKIVVISSSVMEKGYFAYSINLDFRVA